MADKKKDYNYKSIKVTKETHTLLKNYCNDNNMIMKGILDKIVKEYLAEK